MDATNKKHVRIVLSPDSFALLVETLRHAWFDNLGGSLADAAWECLYNLRQPRVIDGETCDRTQFLADALRRVKQEPIESKAVVSHVRAPAALAKVGAS